MSVTPWILEKNLFQARNHSETVHMNTFLTQPGKAEERGRGSCARGQRGAERWDSLEKT